MAASLYICYFGLRQPLVQTQVLPYLRELVKGGHRIRLVTFEPELKTAWSAAEIGRAREELRQEGIGWECLAYHKRPSALATAWDILAGALYARRMVKKERLDILHGRAHVAALMGALGRRWSGAKPKLVFDIRGFMPEEYADAGVWQESGVIFRTAKRVEQWLLRVSDGFVILTEKARKMLFEGETKPVEVIPCCVDFDKRFPPDLDALRTRKRTELGLDGRRVLTHVGALGGLYLTKELVDLVATARRRDASTYAMFLTQSDPADVTTLLQNAHFESKDYFVRRVSPAEVPAYLAASDVGLSLVQATYATQSRSPTKIPEYLAAGLPVLANSGVGDVDELIDRDRVGVLIDSLDENGYTAALDRLDRLGDVSEQCRLVARRSFDLESVGGQRYRRLYDRLQGAKWGRNE
jgi:glycosyltransferase involved in cell wall biosynthesis